MQPTTAAAARALLTLGSGASKRPMISQAQFLILARHFSKKQLSPSIAFLTNSEHDAFMKKGARLNQVKNTDSGKSNSKKLSLAGYSNSEGRPLSILLCWLMSKPRAVQKYAQFYLDQGFDVLTVRISPWQLLWPASYTPVVNNELLPVLRSSPHEKKLIHGFSVGGYVFSQLLKHFHTQPAEYGALARSIQAQIWDSVVDVNGVAVGVSKSVFLNSVVLQRALQRYIEVHMKVLHGVATKYYEEAHEHYYYKPLHAPSLFLASRIDPISTLDVIQAVQAAWNNVGISCQDHLWDNTAHVGHMQRYPNEYKEAIRSFLGKVDWKSSGRAVQPEAVTAEPRPIVVPVPSHGPAPSFA